MQTFCIEILESKFYSQSFGVDIFGTKIHRVFNIMEKFLSQYLGLAKLNIFWIYIVDQIKAVLLRKASKIHSIKERLFVFLSQRTDDFWAKIHCRFPAARCHAVLYLDRCWKVDFEGCVRAN